MSDASANLLDRSEGWVFAEAHDTAILVWLDSPTMEALNPLEWLLVRLRKRHKVFDLLTVGTAGAGNRPLSIEPKAAIASLLKKYEAGIRRSAVCIDDAGLRAAIMRSAITAIDLINRPSYPNRVFSTLPDATAWLCEGTKTKASADRLADQVRLLRRGTS